MFLLRELVKSFIFSRKKRVGFILSVLPTPYYGRIMASTRLRVYDIINAFKDDTTYFLELYKPWKKYDIVIFQKKFDEKALQLAHKLKQEGTKIVLDINVNYYDPTILGVLHRDESINHPKILKFTEIANGVITSTNYIQDYAKQFFPEKNIVCIPENITQSFFAVSKQQHGHQLLTLLYVGYAVKAPEILDIQDILRQLHKKYHFRLLLICEKNPYLTIPGIKIDFHPYRQKTLPKDMLVGDIFLAPRDLTQSYNLGHSFTKIGYPMAVGIPVIASKVPSYEGSPAILCENKNDWYNGLSLLLQNMREREKRAREGREYCRQWYSTDTVRKYYLDFFESILREQ